MSGDEGPEEERPLKRLPEISIIPEPVGAAARDAAQAEAQQFGLGRSAAELKREAASNDHDRAERFRDHFELIAIIALWTIAGIFAVVGAIWFWHLVMPVSAHWLSTDAIGRLQNFFTGGVIATIAGGHIKKRLGG